VARLRNLGFEGLGTPLLRHDFAATRDPRVLRFGRLRAMRGGLIAERKAMLLEPARTTPWPATTVRPKALPDPAMPFARPASCRLGRISAMDPVSQLALGSAVGMAVMGRRTAVWKSALWGGVAGVLPDLDVLIDHGDPILNMVLHRAQTHAFFWQTLFSLPFAALVARLHGEWPLWRRWWLAFWLALVTHALLDAMTVYGTQLLLPLSNHPFGVGSIAIIDPLYTLPLLVGAGWALGSRGSRAGLRANALGLVLSTAYLVWGLLAQQHVERVARASLAAQGIQAEQLLVTPTFFNSLLWRVVALQGSHYHEGFHSLLDTAPQIHFDRFDRGSELAPGVQSIDGAQRLMAFSKGFYKLWRADGRLLIADLRMGQEPYYFFSFAVATAEDPPQPLARSEQLGRRPDIERGLSWLWRRMWGEPLPPPR